jgi:hypothetical protein
MLSPPCGYERILLKLMISSALRIPFCDALPPPLRLFETILYSDEFLCQFKMVASAFIADEYLRPPAYRRQAINEGATIKDEGCEGNIIQNNPTGIG